MLDTISSIRRPAQIRATVVGRCWRDPVITLRPDPNDTSSLLTNVFPSTLLIIRYRLCYIVSTLSQKKINHPRWIIFCRQPASSHAYYNLRDSIAQVVLFSVISVCGCIWVFVITRTLRPIYSDTTQLNSTSTCRRVHNMNNCHLSMNVVTQL